ncbi:GGDEF domain-containing protein [Rhizobium ruizarguesonis]|jgi:diguanylate cyclase (GGDEF)-like protein|uniref:GGDEF domain-containing protein n=1 Tax=Rhizobium ruizarguesonis TaxID=2081791 RepID=UPI0010323183|nr:GGDEF domain-containing protein [Rhizobium ruizarguesonis]TBY94867.1 GGDEF domain-containing protein [Rhizobium leguminosarum bv. viciae]TBA51904.1 GGDEF domain-containing protein [Rhizobium ruizarguesonis]TBA96333.1 GGDEF domain-containing protein [Rhizobium ruizarguesonis]TBA97298.1 GGDEF domain-containing protein [Rhizobium ruizarguesonis]TBB38224.1 GGDEF domain-containing protein [Rhizobium ruizarguesonis]
MDEIFEQLLNLSARTQTLIAVYDSHDRLQYANSAFRSVYFIEPDESPLWPDLMRRNFELRRGTVIQTSNFDEWLRSTQSRRGKIGYRAFETDLHDGRWFWMTEAVQTNGWMLCIASEITSLRARGRIVRQDRDQAIKASYTDELTGVANRRFVMARVDDMLAAAQHGSNGCLVVFDIDNFKHINDRLGHQAGDVVLRDFAHRIHQNVRRNDCFGRVGGEEFVLVMPSTGPEAAIAMVECMLTVIRFSRPLPESPDFSYTCSAGIAACAPSDSASDLYRRADQALYAAKLSGRDRVRAA